MKRYKDGVLTDEYLWPWPMNQRIIDAMVLAGYNDPVDLTRTVFELAGGTMPDWVGVVPNSSFSHSSSLEIRVGPNPLKFKTVITVKIKGKSVKEKVKRFC